MTHPRRRPPETDRPSVEPVGFRAGHAHRRHPGRGRAVRPELPTALEVVSMGHVSALSAEYAHYLIDRQSRRMDGRG